VGGGPLRHKFKARYKKLCHQEDINDSEVEGMIEFKFKRYYKTPWGSLETTLGYLRFELI